MLDHAGGAQRHADKAGSGTTKNQGEAAAAGRYRPAQSSRAREDRAIMRVARLHNGAVDHSSVAQTPERLRRRAIAPTRPRPASIIANASGSGTGVVSRKS